MSTAIPRPWYREPWPWLLMMPPFGAVIGGVAMLLLAVASPEALVVDDYAHIEDLTRLQLAADRRAAELELHATVALEATQTDRARITVELSGGSAFVTPAELTLKLRHAARAEADRSVTLTRNGAAYAGEVDLAMGRYSLELLPSDAAFRLAGSFAGVPATVSIGASGQLTGP
jgi:hypothetical protein